MITCPECGAGNVDGARFCDRCGQGLSAAPVPRLGPVLPPLAIGTELKDGLRIIELLSQTSEENRYRAERVDETGAVERFQVRERRGDEAEPEVLAESRSDEVAPKPAQTGPPSPTAKTAELKLKPTAMGSNPGSSGQAGGLTEARDEAPITTPDPPPAITSNGAVTTGALSEISGQAVVGDDTAEPELSAQDEADSADSASDALPAESNLEGATDVTNALIEPNEFDKSSTLPEEPASDNLGEVFGRVMALSLTLNHPAFERALSGYARDGRVYLIYRDEPITLLTERPGGIRMGEAEALTVAIQICQAVRFAHRRGLRVNDVCPASIGYGADGRIHLIGLDRISNDDELQTDPLYNDGYTAPEIYKGQKADKRADLFSIGAVLYTCLTGERLEAESWREEAGAIRFYPPHVVTPALEQVVRRALVFDPAGRWPNADTLKAELVRLSGTVTIRASVLTDVGMVRELNEDAVMAVEYRRDSQVEPAQNLLYVVADGMGGAAAGELASAIAVGVIRKHVDQGVADSPSINARQLLQEALEAANTQILEYQAAHAEARGMGSTGVSTLIVPPEAAVAWVGDSRAYFYDHSGLRQLTKDHSLVQRLIEIGQLTPEDARHHEHKNVITRSLGARQNGPAGAESLSLRLKRGDKLLMCSDGLTAHVDDAEIAAILCKHSDPGEAARELVVAANAGGGSDNISVVVIFAD
jgi:serine/threonine protein phosphatase PrpC